MTSLRISLRGLFASFALAFTLSAHAADGWRELFNGKDLTGWKANAYPDSWSVVDGTTEAAQCPPNADDPDPALESPCTSHGS